MGFPAQAGVQAVPSFTIPADPGEILLTTHTLFTVPSGEPARIESVYMKAVCALTFDNITIDILLVDLSGVVLYRAGTPTLESGGSAIDTVLLSWARGANGSNQLPVVVPTTSPAGQGMVVYSLPLPPMVLQALSTVQVVIDQESDGGIPAVTVSDISVAYTPGGQGTAQVAADVNPLLVPTTSS